MAISELRGIAFPFTRGSSGLPATVTGSDVVLESMKNLLLTGLNERVMRPALGGGTGRYVFESMTEILKARIARDIRELLTANEPRAEILLVAVDDPKDGTPTFVVNIVYKVADEVEELLLEVARSS